MTMESESEKRQVVESVTSEATLAKAQEKLSRKFLDVEVPKQLSLITMLEKSLADEKKRLGDTVSPENQTAIGEVERQIETLKNDRIVGTLVPLKSTDMLMVRGFVSEAALKAKEMGFDLDVQLLLMAQAEIIGTIYLALRQRNNHGVKYFATQEEATVVEDGTLLTLARLYKETFVLTEEERKNL